MTDEINNHQSDNEQEAGSERTPEFIQSRPGRMVSVSGLVERIVEQFFDEYGENAVDLPDNLPINEQRKYVRDVSEYVFGVESIQLSLPEQARIIARACSEVFGHGPLDELLRNDEITTIAMEGIEKLAVRYGPGQPLTQLEPIFEDVQQMRQIINRLLRDAQADLRDDTPILETGFQFEERRMAISLVMSSASSQIAADVRLHPRSRPTLDMLLEEGFLNADTRTVLEALAKSEHGFIIVGDTEAGKTTLLSAMLQYLSDPESIYTVERSGELDLPDGMKRLVVQWKTTNDANITFGEQITNALKQGAGTIVLDEVRADEPLSIEPLLSMPEPPRQIWSFRGSTDTARIRSALGMLARMSNPGAPEAMVYELYERLPFVVTVKRRRGFVQLREIGEWQFPQDADHTSELVYADYVSLLAVDENVCCPTGKKPYLPLGLPDDFWA